MFNTLLNYRLRKNKYYLNKSYFNNNMYIIVFASQTYRQVLSIKPINNPNKLFVQLYDQISSNQSDLIILKKSLTAFGSC